MRNLVGYPILLLLLTSLSLDGQTKVDEEAVRKLPQSFCDAWARRNGHELAKIMADDVDFVTMAIICLHRRVHYYRFPVLIIFLRSQAYTTTPFDITARLPRHNT